MALGFSFVVSRDVSTYKRMGNERIVFHSAGTYGGCGDIVSRKGMRLFMQLAIAIQIA
jgi:hypothetical protein